MSRTFMTTVAFILVAPAVAFAQRTSVSRDVPIYKNGGLPDLTPDPKRFVSQMEIVDRRLLRFDTVLINSGDGDLKIGSPTDPNNPYASWFVYSPCHNHYHIRDFSNYQLLALDGTTVVAQGHKQAFCLEDLLKYSNDLKSNGYVCANQGITSGWADWYFKQLSGQWIDITGVPEGDYIVHVEINYVKAFPEGQNRYSNVIETTIHVPDPRNKVEVDTSPLLYTQ